MNRRTVNWLKAVSGVIAALLISHWAHIAYVSDFLESVFLSVLAVLLVGPLTGWQMFRPSRPPKDHEYEPLTGDGAVAVRLDACGSDRVEVLDVLRRTAHLDFRQGVTACRRAPSIVGVNLAAEAADAFAAQLRKAGAEVSVLNPDAPANG